MVRSTRHPTENTLAQMGATMRRYMATGTLRRAGGETLDRPASLSSRPTDPPSLKGPSLDGLPNPVPADAYYPQVTVLEPARARSSTPGPAARQAAPFQTSETCASASGTRWLGLRAVQGPGRSRRETARTRGARSMSAAKRYKFGGCETSPRFDHPCWLSVVHADLQVRMAVNSRVWPTMLSSPAGRERSGLGNPCP